MWTSGLQNFKTIGFCCGALLWQPQRTHTDPSIVCGLMAHTFSWPTRPQEALEFSPADPQYLSHMLMRSFWVFWEVRMDISLETSIDPQPSEEIVSGTPKQQKTQYPTATRGSGQTWCGVPRWGTRAGIRYLGLPKFPHSAGALGIGEGAHPVSLDSKEVRGNLDVQKPQESQSLLGFSGRKRRSQCGWKWKSKPAPFQTGSASAFS